jgi:hypothetical protein
MREAATDCVMQNLNNNGNWEGNFHSALTHNIGPYLSPT